MPPPVTRGKVLESFSLYSEQCAVLLERALAVAEPSIPAAVASTFQARYASSSSSSSSNEVEETGLSEPSSASPSSSADEHERSARPVGEPSSDPQRPPTTIVTDLKPQRRAQRKTTALDPRPKDAILRKKHADSVPCVSFDLPDDDDHGCAALEAPLCLLSKDDGRSGVVPQCRSLRTLAGSLRRSESPPTVAVLCLRSGRFAGAIFEHQRCVAHRTAVRYTVRQGQGKAQSAQDAQRRAQSLGAQLRRQGEISLQDDVRKALKDWQNDLARAAIILLSVPRTMQKGLFEEGSGLQRDDPRIRRVPLDLGRPSFENVCLIHSVLTTVTLRERVLVDTVEQQGPLAATAATQGCVATVVKDNDDLAPCIHPLETAPKEETVPLSELHIAAQNGDVEAIRSILSSDLAVELIHQHAGDMWMTPLHCAAESTTTTTATAFDPGLAADCVQLLLEVGGADPCLVDARRRVPVFLASHDRVRDAFRIARANLGEDHCPWDEGAKVGPPLTPEAWQQKNEREAEKKRKKRAKLKEKKAREKAEGQEAEERKREDEERQKQEESAKRIRDGLQPKSRDGGVCDFCQTVCQGRKRAQMFKRLEYSYCSTECVLKHRRELMAAAATARMGGL